MTFTFILQFDHHLCKPFITYFILSFFFISLVNFIILAIITPEIAIAKKYVTYSIRSNQCRLFAEMRAIGRYNSFSAGIASRNFIIEPVHLAIKRTDIAGGKHLL